MDREKSPTVLYWVADHPAVSATLPALGPPYRHWPVPLLPQPRKGRPAPSLPEPNGATDTLLLGALFSILSSASFGINTVFARRGVLGTSATNGIYISVPMGVPLLAIAALLTGQLLRIGALSPRDFLFLAAAGAIHFLLGRYSNYRATAAIGANRSNPLRSISTPFSVIAAVLILGERLSWLNGIGIATVILAPAIMIEGALRPPNAPPPVAAGALTVSAPAPRGFTPTRAQMVEGYIFGILSAVGYGTSPLFVRAAIGGTGLGIVGAFISYSAATAILLVGFLQPGRLSRLLDINRRALWWFILTAISVFFAQMFRYVALDMATVTVVSPLQQSATIFGLFFSFIFNRSLESFKPRVLVGIALSVAGSVAVVWPS